MFTDAELKGLLHKFTVSPTESPLFATSGEMSLILLNQSSRNSRLVRPVSGERSLILLPVRSSVSRLVRPASGEMSLILLLVRKSP